MTKIEESKQSESKKGNGTVIETCGIIMPISASEGYSADHWSDVKNILDEVISDSGFTPNLVSDADEIGIIHNRIVSNIYNNPIMICDVSSKNPNVMFELGLRLAFDKATIIVKDDITNYNFDTAPIEHLTYPKDLRYSVINKFKLKLKDKITATYQASLKPEYSTFLKNFVQYKPKLEVQEISSQDYIFKQLDSINRQLSDIKRYSRNEYEHIRPKVKNIRTQSNSIRSQLIEFMIANPPNKYESKGDFIISFYEHLLNYNNNVSNLSSSELTELLNDITNIYDELIKFPIKEGIE